MTNLTYENQGTNTFLVYQLKKEDVVDTMSMGMISNNSIFGVMPFAYLQKDSEKYFRYNVSSKLSLKQYFAGTVSKKCLLGVLSSISSAILFSEDYMLEASMFIFDMQYIYVNVTTAEATLICLPIVSEEKLTIDMCKFFKDIVFSIQFDQTENCDYVANIISFLNSNVNFSLSEFKKVVDKLLRASISSLQKQTKSQVKEPVKLIEVQPKEIQKKTELNAVKSTIPYIQNVAASVNNVQISETATPLIKNNRESKQKKGWLFGHKKDKKQEKDVITTPQNPFAVPGIKSSTLSMPPISQKDEPQFVNTSLGTQPVLQRNFGETTVLGLSNIGETTVLSTPETGNVNSPYLIRVKKGEKVNINKPVFRIGKEKSYVDYFISDNTAISRSHADIITKNGEYFIIDNNSTNHTYINNVMVQSNLETKIFHGVMLKFANEEFEFKLF